MLECGKWVKGIKVFHLETLIFSTKWKGVKKKITVTFIQKYFKCLFKKTFAKKSPHPRAFYHKLVYELWVGRMIMGTLWVGYYIALSPYPMNT